MDVYDLLMLLILVGATLFGVYKGFAWQLASLGSMLASYFVAVRLREPVSHLISAEPPWNRLAAMLILFLGTSLVVWIAFRFVSRTIDRLKLKEFDRQIGGLFGFGKGVLMCLLVTLFAVTLLGHEKRQAIIESRSGYYIAVLLDRAHVVMPEEVHDIVHPYIHALDSKLNAGEHRHRAEHHHGHPSGQGGVAGPADYDGYSEAHDPRYQPPANPGYEQPRDPARDANRYTPAPARIGPPPAPDYPEPAPRGELFSIPSLLREAIR